MALVPSTRGPTARYDTLRTVIHDFINANFDSLLPESLLVDWEEVGLLAQHVDVIRVAECCKQNT